MKIFKLLVLSASFIYAQGSLTGIVKPIYDAKLSVSTEGMVSKFFLKEGDIVKKNQVILQLDDKLQKLETVRRKLVLDDKTQLVSYRKTLKIMKDILQKKEELYKKTRSVSLNEINKLKMQYINTKAEYESLRANEKKENIEYKIAAEVLDYYKLKSPVGGVITRIVPKVGEWVQSGKEIVHVVDTSTCFVEIDLDISMLNTLKLNSKVNIEVNTGFETIKKEGTIGFISAIADSSSGLIRTKVYFDNKDKAITPGISASVIF